MPIILIIVIHNKVDLRIPLKDLSKIALVSIVNLTTSILLSISYTYVGAGTATSLHFFYPVLVVVIVRLFYKTRINFNQKKSLLIGIIGILFFIDIYDMNRIIGLVTALSSGMTYALYLVWLEKLKLTKLNNYKYIFYTAIISVTYMIIINHFQIERFTICFNISMKGYLLIMAIGILIHVFAMSFVIKSTKLLGSIVVSMISLFEPVSSVIFGYILLKEYVSLNSIVGCILIILSITKMMSDNKLEVEDKTYSINHSVRTDR